MTGNRDFLGRGWNFPPTFRQTGYRVEMLADEADINSSLEILLKTVAGERVMLPRYGADLRPYVFETMTPSMQALIRKLVYEAIVYHEPRIIVREEDLTTTFDATEGRLDIAITYVIVTTNTRYNYVFPFYVYEATDLER